MGKLLPLLLGLVGLGIGLGAGYALKPAAAPADPAAAHGPDTSSDVPGQEAGPAAYAAVADGAHPEAGAGFSYLALENQFIVPLVAGGKVRSLVLVSLSLEIAPGGDENVYARQPRLEDATLTVLFDHANAGGFDGAFTSSGTMAALRGGLREVAQKTVGPAVNDVLITGIVRQDVGA